THYPNIQEIQGLMQRGCKAFLTAVDTEPIHPCLEDARRWFNDLFGAGQIDARNQTCVGFSVSPKIARQLREKLTENNAPLPFKYLMKTRSYEGQNPALSAIIKGESERCFFVSAHAYEPHATNNLAGVASCLEMARTMTKLINDGTLPKPKYSIRFFHGMENFNLYAWGMQNPEKMKNALGGLSLDAFGRLEVEGKREKFVLRRSLNVHASAQHGLAAEILHLACKDSGIDFELREESKNNEDLMQDPQFGPPWNLLYGSLWEEPLHTYPRCYFYHSSNDSVDKLSPLALKTAGVFAASTAFYACNAGEAEQLHMAELACQDWKMAVAQKCREALRLLDEEEPLRRLRAQRLAAWRRLALASGKAAIGNPTLVAEFNEYAQLRVSEALGVLYGGEPPALKSKEHTDILFRQIPGPLGLGTISEELRSLAVDALGYHSLEYWCLDSSGTNLYHFDGKKSVFEVALAIWATRKYGLHEQHDSFQQELQRCAKLAELLLKSGSAVLRKTAAVTKKQIILSLQQLGIQKSDMLMVHSSLKSFGHVEGGADCVIDALQEVLGQSGILAMPAFTDCAEGGTAVFDPENTRIEKWVGLIPETFRKRAGVYRSLHPTHSVCAWGNNAEEFLRQKDCCDTFAEDSPWGKLLRKPGKVLFLGESIGGNTFLHACEAWYNNYLDCTYALRKKNGDTESVLIKDYPGACRGGWYKLGRQAAWFQKIKKLGILQEVRLNNMLSTLFKADSFAAAMKEIFAQQPDILLHREACRDCARLRAKSNRPELKT
ncbi:MAG: DUF4910 domain-containing protein, partial [Lentisphaeria bacterium]